MDLFEISDMVLEIIGIEREEEGGFRKANG